MDSNRPYIPPMQPLLDCNVDDNTNENLKALLAGCSKVIAYYTVRFYDGWGTRNFDYLNYQEEVQELAFLLRKIYETYGELEEDVQEHATDMNFHHSMTTIQKLLGD